MGKMQLRLERLKKGWLRPKAEFEGHAKLSACLVCKQRLLALFNLGFSRFVEPECVSFDH
jgi:hypothetical protein